MKFYTLLLRKESIDFSVFSAEETQRLLADFDAWNASMIGPGKLIVSASLGGKGKIVRQGGVVKDGPFAEPREAVTGFVMIQAEDDAEAAEIASRCPFVSRGGSVEVRPAPQVEFEDAAGPVLSEHAEARAAK